ncbi:ADP-ribosylglycohydrolase family protein [Lachnoclostridium sp. Marseille-P6806]|uniref:ADP-ribosylglycohydrolase family protein n=1 Tax=Lachnoclostridium sp. Marseille-P6806 TaxID=2364793 RepID=UPI001031042B|nr:ADP-ribosylglycohydrolase family protein [Lachnoclostridium sp. Marseille-P6806]
MKTEYIEKIYAGWLAKIIGIRAGAPVEGWTYEKIKNIYGELKGYPADYKTFAADDDSNGPLFFLRGLEDSGHTVDGGKGMVAQDVGNALLNYAPFEHGFFWWGGYGISTEHTAYLNLRNGISAPRSGSIEQNGAAVAEQIGGQIFIDTWGLVAPGNPDLAARFAREAAGVTHDGNGVYGGIFVAAAISYAFEETNIRNIIEKGLSYIPRNCEYTRAVRAVMAFYDEHPGSTWEDCFSYVKANWGYDRYPGNCHIIPNICVMVLALLYGEGDFTKTLLIGCMCGWDTDCNVGNIAAIMGVRGGIDCIDYYIFREPVNDFLACSSVIGSLNIMDIPYGALYITKLAYELAGEVAPEPWKDIMEEHIDSCHFEFPGSTHAIRVRIGSHSPSVPENNRHTYIENSTETAASGSRSLKFTVTPVEPGEDIFVYKKTYYYPGDFTDSRYDPCFSPLVYPGQTIHGSAYIPEYSQDASASLYVHDGYSGKIFEGEHIDIEKGKWAVLSYRLPAMEDVLIDEIGVAFHIKGRHKEFFDYTGFIDDLYADGQQTYAYNMAAASEDFWNGLHREISQFTRLKGLMYLADRELHLSCADFAECYTGRYDWKDYRVQFTITPHTGEFHMVNFRVQGAIRSYAVGLLPGNKVAILKNENGYRVLTEALSYWRKEAPVTIDVTVKGDVIRASVNGAQLEYVDNDRPYLTGQIGISVRDGSHVSLSRISVLEA